MGKDISGTGMDTNIVGRKSNDRAAIGEERPVIHHIYVRSPTQATGGNASGIGSQKCVIGESWSRSTSRKLASTVSLRAIFLLGVCQSILNVTDKRSRQQSGWVDGEAHEFTAMRIRNTLDLEHVDCSETFWNEARQRSDLQIVSSLSALDFDAQGDLPFGRRERWLVMPSC